LESPEDELLGAAAAGVAAGVVLAGAVVDVELELFADASLEDEAEELALLDSLLVPVVP
jgi:hypothetical protein